MVREIEFTRPMVLSLLTSRRTTKPYGMMGGNAGEAGKNILIRRDGERIELPSQCQHDVEAGDRLRILTPGGGGFGKPSNR